MAFKRKAQLVWLQSTDETRLAVFLPLKVRDELEVVPATIRVSDLVLPIITTMPMPHAQTLYRQFISIEMRDGELTAGPVFAVLTAMRKDRFAGNRADMRDLAVTLTRLGGFLYVLPVTSVTPSAPWSGYIRVASKRWMKVPCPRPEAIYNRIPFRAMERTPEALAARRLIEREEIPMFNPEYFNKATIYRTVAKSSAASFLPATDLGFNRERLERMLRRHGAVYLKPCGGSIGHGMIRIEPMSSRWIATSLKKGSHVHDTFDSLNDVWRFVAQHRVPGRYVIQAAKSLLTWDGRPADFRVLLQKHDGEWNVVGRGVRVAGEGGITTHVPNGGSIVSADTVLEASFYTRAKEIDRELTGAVLACARVIDESYQRRLGEMSMDIGIESNGRIWFLEANSKPMKFDEPPIRKASLEGVIRHLLEMKRSAKRSLSAIH